MHHVHLFEEIMATIAETPNTKLKLNLPSHKVVLEQVWDEILEMEGKVKLTGAYQYKQGKEFRKPKLETRSMHFNNEMAIRLIKRGISSGTVSPLASFLGVKKSELTDTLGMDRSTAARRLERKQPLPNHSAEGVLRIMELVTLAEDVFDTGESALGWIRRVHPMLDNETPLEAAKTSFGARRVSDILIAIKYGGVA